MPISFNQVPTGLRVPFVAVEIDSSRAQQGPSLLEYRALIIGQKITAGTGAANGLYKVTSEAQAIALAGRGSLAHRMARAWFRNNGGATETWLGLLADDGAAVAASGTIDVTGPATAAGTIALYIGGERLTIAVANGDTANTIAAAINSAINAALDLPVTSTVDLAAVTISARNAGVIGNELDIRTNYNDGEVLPAGVGVTITPMANGATNPVLTSLITAMADTWFHIIVNPYKDDTSLDALEAEADSRFGPTRMIDTCIFSAAVDTYANLTTLGNSRNSPHLTIVGAQGAPRPAFETAARVAANVAFYGRQDPARPFQTLPLTDELPPAESSKLTLAERNLLLNDGISTLRNEAGGVVSIERLITTYQTNSAGAADDAYLDVTTMLTLMYLRYSFRVQIATRYPRHKLADDGTRFGAGQKVMTPSIGKAEAILWFRQMEDLGLVENFPLFKANLVVERNETDQSRLDFLLPPDIINQLIVSAAQIQFRL